LASLGLRLTQQQLASNTRRLQVNRQFHGIKVHGVPHQTEHLSLIRTTALLIAAIVRRRAIHDLIVWSLHSQPR